jgi:hypothetical protein
MGKSGILNNYLTKEERMLHRFGVISGVIVIAMLLITGCSGERGLQGESGTAECIQCHNDNTTILAIDGQWRNSVHFTGGNFERNTPPCSGCHTNEGFVARMNGEDPGTPENPSPLSCFGCHEPHTNHNFFLRTTAPVDLQTGGNFNYGSGNLCAQCHQARTPDPLLVGSVSITSSRWGPHHGPQADILNGTGAYVFAGQSYRNSRHNTAVTNGCPQCHMATPYGTQAGGHTMNMTYVSHGSEEELLAGCNIEDCHNGALDDFDYLGYQDSVATYLEELYTDLVNVGYVNSSTGLINASSSNPLQLTEAQAGALYNYYLIEADRSGGVHNSKYVVDALKASIAALGAK